VGAGLFVQRARQELHKRAAVNVGREACLVRPCSPYWTNKQSDMLHPGEGGLLNTEHTVYAFAIIPHSILPQDGNALWFSEQ
jgi:hypothetical protein